MIPEPYYSSTRASRGIRPGYGEFKNIFAKSGDVSRYITTEHDGAKICLARHRMCFEVPGYELGIQRRKYTLYLVGNKYKFIASAHRSIRKISRANPGRSAVKYLARYLAPGTN